MKQIVLLMMLSILVACKGRRYIQGQFGGDFEDLHQCLYRQPRCPQSEFNCKCAHDPRGSSFECIPQSWVCDGQTDCSYGTDEIDCICDPGDYQCYDGVGVKFYQCVEGSKECDGRPNRWPIDCFNRRDEYNEKCPAGFQCMNGLYIPYSWTCNGGDGCGDNSDELNCGFIGCPQHTCGCYQRESDTCQGAMKCYRDRQKCDGYARCYDGSDERSCPSCPPSKKLRCACNKPDNYTCKGKGFVCFNRKERCNGRARCVDGSDELNCLSCPKSKPLRCACSKADDYTCKRRGFSCYRRRDKCDARRNCPDSSDEMNCVCPKNKFSCACFRENLPICSWRHGCIPMEYVNDGKPDCPYYGNDEDYIKGGNSMICGSCDVIIIRLESKGFCNPPWCDNKTCHNVPSTECKGHDCNMSDVVCTSFCSDNDTEINCKKVLQCSDQSLTLNENFCNGKVDCKDGSDEFVSQPGFKCSAKFSTILCVLPQWNLYDDIPQCYDESDLCFGSDGSFHCFKCLDNRLIISPKQVCDGVIDCFDFSDECLCENPSLPECLDVFFHSPQCCNVQLKYMKANALAIIGTSCPNNVRCENSSQLKYLTTCESKRGLTRATMCDGRPECIDFADECLTCSNVPAFCNDTCHSYFRMGERYCDGFIDQAWKYLKNTNCSKGFDEKHCPMRFQCKAGSRVSIDVLQRCDGNEDCDDGRDEKNCPNRHCCTTKVGNLKSVPKTSVLNGKQDCVDGTDEFVPGLFSSARNMIDNLGLRIWLWFVTILTIFGNFYVAVLSIANIKDKMRKEGSVCNHILIINLTVADCLMGVYLMIVLVKDFQFSGRYSKFDYEWRSSSLCALAGSLCVISSQTSCFLMCILTSYRLFAVLRPFQARRASAKPWIFAAIFFWGFSFGLALVSNTTRYFKSKVLFLNEFSSSDTVTHDYVTDFTCRLAILTNTTHDLEETSWSSVRGFLEDKFPQYAPKGEIGYYGSTSVCMPRLYVNRGETFWTYSIVMITLNFLSFVFVLFGFAFIAWRIKKRPIKSKNAQRRNVKINQRIARIIISDFLCWVPICVMAYLSVSGVKLPDGVEIFTAGVLLPINSAFNPVLYSPYIETKVRNLWKKVCSNCNQLDETNHETNDERDATELNVLS